MTSLVSIAVLAGLFLATRKKAKPVTTAANDGPNVRPGVGDPQLAMIAGDPKDPEIAALLSEFDDYLASYGVGKYTCAEEMFGMPEAPKIAGRRPVAIPEKPEPATAEEETAKAVEKEEQETDDESKIQMEN